MRVALLYPDAYELARFGKLRKEFPPLGVLSLAAAAERDGHDVSMLNINGESKPYDLRSFDAVGFSLSSSATYPDMLTAWQVALVDSQALIMLGGIHCQLYPEQCLADFGGHVAAVTDAETIINPILERGDGKDFSGINGVVWRGCDGLHREAPLCLPRTLAGLDPPARHLLPSQELIVNDRLAGTSKVMTHVAFSRGCAYDCRFCAAGSRSVRYRTGAEAHAELAGLIDTYGIEGFAIVEDNFTLRRRDVLQISNAIADLSLAWSALSRVDTVDRGMLQAMAAAGCIEIKYGMESGSRRLLAAMGKRITPEQTRQAAAWTAEVGIGTKLFVLHGFPGENAESTEETIAMLKSLGSSISRVSLYRFVPLPGSYVYEHADEYDLHGTHHDSDWDGDWSRFHIYHDARHWWGTERDWLELQESYERLKEFVESRWDAQE